jgi:hypothetical protein
MTEAMQPASPSALALAVASPMQLRQSPHLVEHDLVRSPLGFGLALEKLRDLATPALIEQVRPPAQSVANASWPRASQLAADRTAEQDLVNSKALPGLTLSLGIFCALSRRREDNVTAVGLLQDLIDDAVSASLTGDCLLWTAVAKLHLGEYRDARLFCERLALRDPERKGAVELHGAIRRKVRNDGMAGLAVVSAVMVLVTIAGNVLFRRR